MVTAGQKRLKHGSKKGVTAAVGMGTRVCFGRQLRLFLGRGPQPSSLAQAAYIGHAYTMSTLQLCTRAAGAAAAACVSVAV